MFDNLKLFHDIFARRLAYGLFLPIRLLPKQHNRRRESWRCAGAHMVILAVAPPALQPVRLAH